MSSETPGHRRLKKSIKKILENADFKFIDTEVQIDMHGNGETELSIDVCALDGDVLFIFECKDTAGFSEPKKNIAAKMYRIEQIYQKKFKVLYSDEGQISYKTLCKVSQIKLCYVFSDKLVSKNTKEQIENEGCFFWDANTVKYFSRVSQVLNELTKNEIMKEFNVKFIGKNIRKENAVEIKQGNNIMYLLGMHPKILLTIAYIYRRTGGKPNAYQRIITKERIENISNFFQESRNILLPNPVIIVFDNEQEIQEELKYEKGQLKFPIQYCSAWIIDGQHRIYGFKNHPKYRKWPQINSDDFRIPVVAFKQLSLPAQSKTFININYYQKKINSVLFNDLATIIQDLKYEITWPSLLVAELNRQDPWKNMIKISELDIKRPITISGFAKTKLLTKLLKYDKKTKQYSGNLYRIAPFNPNKKFSNSENQEAFKKQINILIRFFQAVKINAEDEDKAKDMWVNHKQYGLTKFTSVNALLLVLDKLLEKDPILSIDLVEKLSSIHAVDFRNEQLLQYGRGYPAMPKIANKIIEKMNSQYDMTLNSI